MVSGRAHVQKLSPQQQQQSGSLVDLWAYAAGKKWQLFNLAKEKQESWWSLNETFSVGSFKISL